MAVAMSAAAWASANAVNRPLLGVAGKPERFQRQTGQVSTVRHIFIGWEQGRSWGSPFATLFSGLRPVPMIHIGTDRGRQRREAITPAGIAAGRGDAYLVALNGAIARFGSPMYVRFLAEMNNPSNLYSPVDEHGRSRGPSHSAAAYRQAFRRAYVILHGGDVDGRLRALGQRPLGRSLPANPVGRLNVIWNPIAGMDSGSRRPAQRFYPGDRFVDVVGNDMYARHYGVASHAANEALYRAHPWKPYAIAEWGTSVDDAGFVNAVCSFLKTHPRTRLAAYYSVRGSPWELTDKRRARAAYRRCVTPLGAR
jgi:Glycosyl hydrolase family 26